MFIKTVWIVTLTIHKCNYNRNLVVVSFKVIVIVSSVHHKLTKLVYFKFICFFFFLIYYSQIHSMGISSSKIIIVFIKVVNIICILKIANMFKT